MLAVPLHHFISVSQQNGGAQERHVDENLPLDVVGVFVRDIHERFEQMDARNSYQ